MGLGRAQLSADRAAGALTSFRQALELAELADDASDESLAETRAAVRWTEEILVAESEAAPQWSAASLATLTGRYEDREVGLPEGVLSYRRGDNPWRPMHHFRESTFVIAGIDGFRLEFVLDDNDRPSKLIGHTIEGYQDVTERTSETE